MACAGARQNGEGSDNLHVLIRWPDWPDQDDSWVNVGALHVRDRWHIKLIRFYESKAKRVGKAAESVAEAAVDEDVRAPQVSGGADFHSVASSMMPAATVIC